MPLLTLLLQRAGAHLAQGEFSQALDPFAQALTLLERQERRGPFSNGSWPIQYLPLVLQPLQDAVETSPAADVCLPLLARALSLLERMHLPLETHPDDRSIQSITVAIFNRLVQQRRLAPLAAFGQALVDAGGGPAGVSDAALLGALAGAEVAAAENDWDRAEQLYLRLIEARKAASHADHILMRAVATLGQHYLTTHQLGAAEALVLPYYNPGTDALGHYEDLDRIVLIHLSALYRDRGDRDQQEPILRKAIRAAVHTEGPTSVGLVPLYLDLALCLLQQSPPPLEEIHWLLAHAYALSRTNRHAGGTIARDVYANWLRTRGWIEEAGRVERDG